MDEFPTSQGSALSRKATGAGASPEAPGGRRAGQTLAAILSPSPQQWHRMLAWTAVLSFVSLVSGFGFALPRGVVMALDGLNLALACVYCWAYAIPLLQNRRKWRAALRQHRFPCLLIALFLAASLAVLALPDEKLARFLAFFHLRSGAELYFDIVRSFLLANVLVQILRFQERLIQKLVRPEMVLAGSFAGLIAAGTLLLLLPRAAANPDKPMSFVDALFTSTSAACVTGLVVRDTGADFSALGQIVILVIFQVGGLGIMTFVAFLAVFSSESLPIPQVMAFKQMVGAQTIRGLKRQILAMIVATLVIEAAGAALLFLWLPSTMDPVARLHWSVFHAISAFCNAGFALQAGSLESLQGHAGMNLTFMALIVLGGLGFLVIPELLRCVAPARWLRRLPGLQGLYAGRAVRRMGVQARLSLVVTVCLLVFGFAGFWLLEAGHALGAMSLKESLLISAFQSITARTAGFNTVTIGQLQDSTLILIMVLMVIGACPVSTGGGIKTVTFGVLVLALRAMVTGNERVEAFGRALPPRVLFAALSVFVLYVLAAVAGVFCLSLLDPQMPLQDQIFEVVSALSTVGLSTGITAELSTPGKLVLCVAMFIGRVGPIALVLSVFKARPRVTYEYPEENVIVG